MNPKSFTAGCIATISLLAVVGACLRFVPNETPLSAIARILDSLAPWFLLLGMVCAIGALALSARLLGGLLAVLCLAMAVHLAADHRARSLPLAADLLPDLRVLFFNMLGDNMAFADRIVTEVLKADPDILVIAEGEGLYPALKRLRRVYTFVSPCDYEDCELIIASKRAPLRFWTLSLNVAWDDRYGVTEITTGTGKQFFLAANHSIKP